MLTTLVAATILPQNAKTLYYGGDVSEIPEVEAAGGVYRVGGKAVDPIKAMKAAGWTAIRLRVWNNPKDGFCNEAYTLAMAKRIKAEGMTLMIDFHYSDWWADPGKQNKPAAWKDLDKEGLKTAIREYTATVVRNLANQGTPAEVVQVGNEVTNGFLWPESRLNLNGDGWTEFIELTKAGIEGAREGSPRHKPKIMVHIDQGGRNNVSRFWLDQYFAKGGEADLIGLSYYPFWHGTMKELKANLADVAARYKRDVLVAETAYPWKGWNDTTRQYDENAVPDSRFKATPVGQAAFLKELVNIVKGVPGKRGVGVLWWAPAWIGSKGAGGGWSRYTTFDPESGEALPAFFGLRS